MKTGEIRQCSQLSMKTVLMLLSLGGGVGFLQPPGAWEGSEAWLQRGRASGRGVPVCNRLRPVNFDGPKNGHRDRPGVFDSEGRAVNCEVDARSRIQFKLRASDDGGDLQVERSDLLETTADATAGGIAIAATSGPEDVALQTEKEPEIKDSFLDRILQRFIAAKLKEAIDKAREAELSTGTPIRGQEIAYSTVAGPDPGDNIAFNDMVEAALNLSRQPGWMTQLLVLELLRSSFPSWFLKASKVLLGLFPSWFVARHASAVTLLLTGWLVGGGEVTDVEPHALDDDDSQRGRGWGQTPTGWLPGFALGGPWRKEVGAGQGVLLTKCRVLEGSNCASVCVNVCKGPTQTFFKEDFGLPLTMNPDYETMECQFLFGVTPPDLAEDDALRSSCLPECSLAGRKGDCGPGGLNSSGKKQKDQDQETCSGLQTSADNL